MIRKDADYSVPLIPDLESKIAERFRAEMLCNATYPKPAVVFLRSAEVPPPRLRADIDVASFTDVALMPPAWQTFPSRVADSGALFASLVTGSPDDRVDFVKARDAIDVENFSPVPAH